MFPTLYAIALDYLPIQASAVPCERVFSSSAEMDTKRHNRIHPTLMEALQIVKFSLKQKRLDFTGGWATAVHNMQDYDVDNGPDLLHGLSIGADDAMDDIMATICLDDDNDNEDL